MELTKVESRNPEAMLAFSGFQSSVKDLTRYAGELSRLMRDTPPATPRHGFMPAIWYSELHLHCGGRRVTMNSRPLLFKLFKTFIDAPGHALSRDELLSVVYPTVINDAVSNRYRETQAHNLIKLLGRGRDLAERFLDTDTGIRWFVYDMRTGTWSLREYRRPKVDHDAMM
jgi:hypothetical protein